MSKGERRSQAEQPTLPDIPRNIESRSSAFIETLSWAYVRRARSILEEKCTLPIVLTDALFLLRDAYNEALEREEETGTPSDPINGNDKLFEEFRAILTPPKKENVGRSFSGNRKTRQGESALGGQTFF